MLIDDIIGALSDNSADLADTLLKTKVLLHQIGKKELAEWVNHELGGYPIGTDLPPYRVMRTEIRANVSNAAWRHSNTSLPLSHMESQDRERLERVDYRESLASVATLLTGEAHTLSASVPMELYGMLGQQLTGGYRVEKAWKMISRGAVANIQTSVRSRLLDFVLALKDEIGDVSTQQEMVAKAAGVNATGLFNGAVFGNNTTVVVGDNNSTSIVNGVSAGDLASLMSALNSLGVPAAEQESLKAIIIDEKATGETKSISAKIGEWLTALANQAATGAITTGAGVAGSAVTTALMRYLGML